MPTYAWTFAARTPGEVAALLRAMQRHRYLQEVDHGLHFSVDLALRHEPAHAARALAVARGLEEARDLDLGSRDLRLWRRADVEEVIAALLRFWMPADDAREVHEALASALKTTELPPAAHPPFACDPDDPPHPELVLLDWVLLPVDELDVARHAGALRAMEAGGDEVSASSPLYVEGPILAEPELLRGARNGVLARDFVLWADGPYSYADYVFRGVSRAAGLVDPPVGYRDVDAAAP